jgi:hypothetical protein
MSQMVAPTPRSTRHAAGGLTPATDDDLDEVGLQEMFNGHLRLRWCYGLWGFGFGALAICCFR